jgi:hypothetical protein
MAEVSKVVWQWVISNVGWSVIIILFLLSCVFKIAKKEIDPLSWVIGLIGKPLTKAVRDDVADLKKVTNQKITDLRSDLDGFEKATNKSVADIKIGTAANCKALQKRLSAIEKSNDMQTIRQIRAHILDFANSCMNNRQHSKKEFDNIIDENSKYEVLVKKYKVKNAVYKEEYKFIMDVYHYNQKTNGFLKGNDPQES